MTEEKETDKQRMKIERVRNMNEQAGMQMDPENAKEFVEGLQEAIEESHAEEIRILTEADTQQALDETAARKVFMGDAHAHSEERAKKIAHESIREGNPYFGPYEIWTKFSLYSRWERIWNGFGMNHILFLNGEAVDGAGVLVMCGLWFALGGIVMGFVSGLVYPAWSIAEFWWCWFLTVVCMCGIVLSCSLTAFGVGCLWALWKCGPGDDSEEDEIE